MKFLAPFAHFVQFLLPTKSIESAPATELVVETLERRNMLSGNVSVSIDREHLSISGDAAGNSVEIRLVDSNWVVRGTEGTTINGATNDFQITRTGDLRVDLGAGTDRFLLDGDATWSGNIRIDGNDGDDQIGFGAASIDGQVLVWGGNGNDSILVRNTRISEDLKMRTGDGDDLVVLENADVTRRLGVRARSGADGVRINNSTIGRTAHFALGSGSDSLSLASSEFQKHLIVAEGQGDDFLDVKTTQVAGLAVIVAGRGSDSTVVDNQSSFGTLIHLGGAGEDAAAGMPNNESTFNFGTEGSAVAPTLVAQRLTDATTGLIPKATALVISFYPTAGVLTLSVDTSENTLVQSNGTSITKTAGFKIKGSTLPGATVTVARDGDSVFDDATTTADSNGNYSLTVTLLNNSTNRGANQLVVKATIDSQTETKIIDVHYAVGSVVRFTSNVGAFDVELLDAQAPITVANFLSYQSQFADTIVHRSEKTTSGAPFVIQGGGFKLSAGNLTPVATAAAIQNEFNAANSNVRGTIAMALPTGNINGATSQWFVNMGNNSALDAQKFVAFGRVIGTGMATADQIHNLPSFDFSAAFNQVALTELPLQSYTEFTKTLDGTVSTTSGNTTITGVGTKFNEQLVVGETIKIGTTLFRIATITNATTLTVTQAPTTTTTAQTVTANQKPTDSQYVVMTSIAKLFTT